MRSVFLCLPLLVFITVTNRPLPVESALISKIFRKNYVLAKPEFVIKPQIYLGGKVKDGKSFGSKLKKTVRNVIVLKALGTIPLIGVLKKFGPKVNVNLPKLSNIQLPTLSLTVGKSKKEEKKKPQKIAWLPPNEDQHWNHHEDFKIDDDNYQHIDQHFDDTLHVDETKIKRNHKSKKPRVVLIDESAIKRKKIKRRKTKRRRDE